MTAAFDQFQREMIVENTKAGLANASWKGRKGGRPPTVSAMLSTERHVKYLSEFRGRFRTFMGLDPVCR